MKTFLTSIAIVCCSHSFAQNIGVGTATPQEKIEVAGNIKADTAKINALTLNNGFIQVAGNNRTAFVHTATAGNLVPGVPYATALTYPNQQASDIILVTHNYNPAGKPAQYLNSPISVWWTGTAWSIYNENFSNMLTDGAKSFNVLVIKQ